jgi:hypothetical protein
MMILGSIPLVRVDSIFWALIPFYFYLGGYIASVPPGNPPWWYYGMVVDGEYMVLLVFSLLLR